MEKNTKKKGKLKWIIAAVVVIAVFLIMAGSEEDTAPMEKQNETQQTNVDIEDLTQDGTEKEQKTEVKEDEMSQADVESEALLQESSKTEKDYYELGETVRFTSGLELTLTDVGTVRDNVLGENYVYIMAEAENTGTESIQISGGYFHFYADDYSMNNSYFNDNYLQSQCLDPGRKTAGKVFAECNDYDTINVLEVQFGDAVFRLKDVMTEAEVIQNEMDLLESLAISGRYAEMEGNSEISISMYSSPEENSVGKAEVHFESGEYDYSGEIAKTDTNVYKLLNTDDEVLFEIYEAKYDLMYLAFYVNGEFIGEYWMQEHYES